MEAWREVWRKGFAPLFPVEALEALAAGLSENDEKLTQGSTTTPLPTPNVADWDCEAADALGYGFWRAGLLRTVGQVEETFARLCFEADVRMGEPAACRHFLHWFDDTPRAQMVKALLAEVSAVLESRKALV